MTGYDYIIVGAGSAGCILANRLSEDASCRVLLLEAGSDDRRLRVRLPIAATSLWFDAAVNWGYASDPEPNCDGRRLPVPRGKLVGGSSSINGLFHVRGHPLDYDGWERQGAHGWGYEQVLPFFKSIESHWRGAGPFHGDSGPVRVTRCECEPRLVEAVLAAATRAGYPISKDLNGAEPEGFALPDLAVRRGRRCSSADAFLRPVRHRGNLVIETDARCTRVVVSKGRATGIEYVSNGQARTAAAGREVVLSAGAINSPQLLMLSGIGPADQLKALGIAPVADLAGVGANLQDHPGTGIDIACAKPFGFDRELRYDRFAASLVRWAAAGTGPAATLPVAANAFIRSRPELARPDLQMMVLTVSPFAKLWFPGVRKPKGQTLVTRIILLHPESRGSVSLGSADPMSKPRIQFNLLAAPADRATLRESIRLARRLFAQTPLAELSGGELTPGPAIDSDEQIDAYIRKTLGTFFHPSGTCAMGSSATAVVDPQLRVRGVDGLRVVDASVMPTIPGGNINAPTMMIAERAAAQMTGRLTRAAQPHAS